MMKAIVLSIFLFLVLAFSLPSCYDIFEEDLSKSKVTILSPKDSITITSSNVTFWWNEVERASRYRLQLVKPTFNAISQFIVDTNVTGDKFQISLSPGKYEWRIQAINNSTSGLFTTAVFFIDSNLNIANERIFLISPSNLSISTLRPIVFRWQNLQIANSYRFQLFDSTQALVVSASDILSNQLLVNQNLPDNKYTWRVRGENDNGVTQYASFSFVLDSTPPSPPILVSPTNNFSSLNGIINFQWNPGIDNIENDFSKLVIATDSFFTNPIVEQDITNTSYSDTFTFGRYFWSLKSVDKAGNQSRWSFARSFDVQ